MIIAGVSAFSNIHVSQLTGTAKNKPQTALKKKSIPESLIGKFTLIFYSWRCLYVNSRLGNDQNDDDNDDDASTHYSNSDFDDWLSKIDI